MTGKGQYNKTTENLAIRYYLNEASANEYLDCIRKLYARKGAETRVTTKGRGYFTMKYGWPNFGTPTGSRLTRRTTKKQRPGRGDALHGFQTLK